MGQQGCRKLPKCKDLEGICASGLNAGGELGLHPLPALAEGRAQRLIPARRVPGADVGDVGGIAEALRPQVDVAPRRQRAQALLPWLRIESGDGEEDRAHQNTVRFAQSTAADAGCPFPSRSRGDVSPRRMLIVDGSIAHQAL